VVAIPLWAPTLAVTITDFGGNDIFQISASGFVAALEEGIALSMSASTTGVFVSDANPPQVLVPTSVSTLVQVSPALTDGTGLNPAVVIATLRVPRSALINLQLSPNPGWQ